MKTTTHRDTINPSFMQYVRELTLQLLNVLPSRVNNIYCAPKAVKSISAVKSITDNIGITINGIKTFKTDYIGYDNPTSYNGFNLQLTTQADKVVMNIQIDEEVYPLASWDISTLITRLDGKNPDVQFTEQMVNALITSNRMSVKFNVSTTKDHGTIWRISNVNIPETVKPSPIVDDDFFSDF